MTIRKAVMAFGIVVLAASGAAAGSQNDAGCGVGSMIFKENTTGSQILAATTNGILGNQTFGITSGTLNCGDSAGRASVEQESYIAANFRNLSREMAAGEGEYVSSLGTLMGCQSGSDFARFTQAHYETLFATDSVEPAALLQALKVEMAKDATLSASCAL